MAKRELLRAFALAFAFSAAAELPADADDGRPPDREDRPTPIAIPRSALRPTAIATASPAATEQPLARDIPGAASTTTPCTKEVVIFVGGYGSDNNDDAFRAIATRLPSERYDKVRFGKDRAFPYDTYGSLSTSAAALTAQVRYLQPRYCAVHLVGHSQGAAVVDVALANGLSSADGVKTDVAIAGPHSGSVIAAVADRVLRIVPDVADLVRGIVMLFKKPDPKSDAAHDLATLRPHGPPARIVKVDVSIANDGVVGPDDARDPGVPQRLLAPLKGEADGHGDALNDPRVADLVARTIAERRVPESDPAAGYVPGNAPLPVFFWRLCAFALLGVVCFCAYCAFALALARRSSSILRPVIDLGNALARRFLRAHGR
jgi:pimeloyl-ACP methyl ester carboxylesterase